MHAKLNEREHLNTHLKARASRLELKKIQINQVEM